MMGLSISPTSMSEALTLLNTMLDPQKVKQVMEELNQQVTALNQLRDEVAVLQKQADADRAAVDQMMADVARREGALAEQEADISRREVAFAAAKRKIVEGLPTLS
jgi:peptidoglycan hydrolase CwlO-like protein